MTASSKENAVAIATEIATTIVVVLVVEKVYNIYKARKAKKNLV
jgi:hypothetical protein